MAIIKTIVDEDGKLIYPATDATAVFITDDNKNTTTVDQAFRIVNDSLEDRMDALLAEMQQMRDIMATVVRYDVDDVTPIEPIIIDTQEVTIPTIIQGDFTYSGVEQGPIILGYDPDTTDLSGEYKATDAGHYQFVFSLKDTESMHWSDGDESTEPKSYGWEIKPRKISQPSVIINNYLYNGQEQGPIIQGFDSSTMEIEGTTKATDAGTYNFTIKLTDKVNTEWTNGTTEDLMYTWYIKLDSQSLTISKTSVSLTNSVPSDTVIVGNIQGREIVVTSDNEDIHANYNDGTITVTDPNSVNTEATITVTALPSTLYDGDTKTFTVTSNFNWNLSVSSSSISLDTYKGNSDSVTVGNLAGRTLTVSSNSTSIVAEVYDGDRVRITNTTYQNGNATVTITASDGIPSHTASVNVSVSSSFQENIYSNDLPDINTGSSVNKGLYVDRNNMNNIHYFTVSNLCGRQLSVTFDNTGFSYSVRVDGDKVYLTASTSSTFKDKTTGTMHIRAIANQYHPESTVDYMVYEDNDDSVDYSPARVTIMRNMISTFELDHLHGRTWNTPESIFSGQTFKLQFQKMTEDETNDWVMYSVSTPTYTNVSGEIRVHVNANGNYSAKDISIPFTINA